MYAESSCCRNAVSVVVAVCLRSSVGRRSSVGPFGCVAASFALRPRVGVAWVLGSSPVFVLRSHVVTALSVLLSHCLCFALRASFLNRSQCSVLSKVVDPGFLRVLGVLESFAFACHTCTVCSAVASPAVCVSRSSARRSQHSVSSRDRGCRRPSPLRSCHIQLSRIASPAAISKGLGFGLRSSVDYSGLGIFSGHVLCKMHHRWVRARLLSCVPSHLAHSTQSQRNAFARRL